MIMRIRLLPLAALLLASLLLTGCGASSEVKQLQEQVQTLRTQVSQLQSDTRLSLEASHKALEAAQGSGRKADAAMDAANTAQRAADECSDLCSRTMRRAQMK